MFDSVNSVADYRKLVYSLVQAVLYWSFMNDGPYPTHAAIAGSIGLSKSQFSKVVNGVSSLSGPCFARLCRLVGLLRGEKFLFDLIEKSVK